MPMIHNQINNFWYKPSYNKFIKSAFVKQIFMRENAEDFTATGAYLVRMAKRISKKHIPWCENRRLEILANPRLENALFSLGAEYLIKGIFLHKGYAVNRQKQRFTFQSYPILLKNNKGKLEKSEVSSLSYFKTYISRIINFSKFDNRQEKKELYEKKKEKGQKLSGITRMTIPYPKSSELLDYILFKRNYSLHRPFIMSEFVGLTNQLYDFLNYIAMNGCGKSINNLARLKKQNG